MGKFFNQNLLRTNKIFGKARLSSPFEEMRKKFNEQNLDSTKSQEESLVSPAGADEGQSEHDNPPAQDRPKRVGRTGKGAAGKKGRNKRNADK